jgi:hypothetical protein
MIIICHLIDAPLPLALIHMHHTGLQAESPVAVPEEPEEPQEVQAQEVPEADEEVGEELQKCPDHRPSSFERGKPRSIISLLLYEKAI